jgi:hypothetical protein
MCAHSHVHRQLGEYDLLSSEVDGTIPIAFSTLAVYLGSMDLLCSVKVSDSAEQSGHFDMLGRSVLLGDGEHYRLADVGLVWVLQAAECK